MHFESSSYTYRCIILFLYPCAVRIVFQIKALNMWVVEHMWEPCVDRLFVVYNIYVGMWKKADKLLWRSLVGNRGRVLKLLNKANKNTNIIFFLIIQSFNKLLYESRVQLFIFFYCFVGWVVLVFFFLFSFLSFLKILQVDLILTQFQYCYYKFSSSHSFIQFKLCLCGPYLW